MRASILAFAAAITAFGAAQAQALYPDPNAYTPAQQAFEMAQRDNLYRQQEAQAAQARADTEQRLTDLAAQRQATGAALDNGALAAGAQIDAQLGADSARNDQLMAPAMARSKARVLAVKPVTR